MTDQQRLANIEAQQARIIALIEALGDRLDEEKATAQQDRSRLYRVIFGDGNGNKGMVVRLDRLEGAHERARWTIRAIGGAVTSLLVGAAWQLLRSVGG